MRLAIATMMAVSSTYLFLTTGTCRSLHPISVIASHRSARNSARHKPVYLVRRRRSISYCGIFGVASKAAQSSTR